MAILLFIILHWYLSGFAQSFFNHRYAAHRMFSMSLFTEKVFFIFSFITAGSSYMSPYVYGILHRMHHAYADTEKDPHSPSFDSNPFSMMWRTYKVFSDILNRRIAIENKFTKDLPQWDSFDRFASSLLVKISWGVIYTIFYIQFATAWWMFLFLPFHFVIGPLQGIVINWFAHKVGYTNFRINNTSKNLLLIDFLTWGEGYHNNHHAFSSKVNFAKKWFEVDPVYQVIRFFRLLKIIRV